MKREVWDQLMSLLAEWAKEFDPPAVTKEAQQSKDPFRVLIATVLSARTKDEVTYESATRLFRLASTPEAMANLSEEKIAEAIKPVNFYVTKAKRVKQIAGILVTKHNGKVPEDLETLLTLPGVGRKTANLVLAEGHGLDGVCVDTHVHRILNRLGLAKTKKPVETEFFLRKVLPKEYWVKINTYLVSFGQRVCTPVSPFCSQCVISSLCKKVGVGRHR